MSDKVRHKGRSVKVGAVVYKSIAHAADANKVPYMTMYLRIRRGWSAAQSANRKVRPYVKQGAVV